MKSKNLFDIKNKLILVFGGSSGIGKSIGQAIAHNGAFVIFIGRKLLKFENYFSLFFIFLFTLKIKIAQKINERFAHELNN
jgi:NAD(P)-dependent dehydrogenase (short-subunit alcohol dehydrogenase family)